MLHHAHFLYIFNKLCHLLGGVFGTGLYLQPPSDRVIIKLPCEGRHRRAKNMKGSADMKKADLKGIEREMYLYFSGYSEAGAPSFVKFARKKGLTTEELLSLRTKKKFDRAYAECMQIRRDYLIDKALTKSFDGSLVKFLLDLESKSTEADELHIRLEVI